MSKHLSRQKLLAYLDGELSRMEALGVVRHLHACWQCRADLKRLESNIADIVDAHHEVFAAALPAPPRLWLSFDTLLAQNELSSDTSSRARWVSTFFNSLWKPARILAAACTLAAISIFCWMTLRPAPVSAREVLHRIQMAGIADAPTTRDRVLRERVHIRKRTLQGTHPRSEEMSAWKSQSSTFWQIQDSDSTVTELEEEYQAHRIPIDLPLSAASVDRWGQAAGGDPVVSRHGDDFDLTFAGTQTAGPDTPDTVERVSFLVRSQDWRVEQMTLQFSAASFDVVNDDLSQLPISAVPRAVLAHLEPENALPLAQPEARLATVSSPGRQTAHIDLDVVELGVFDTLHRMNADLGEPITISRQANEIQVGIWEVPPDRRNVLSAALEGKPGVVIRDTEPAYPPTLPGYTRVVQLQAQSDSASHSGTNEDRRFSQFFGGADNEEAFTRQALVTSTAMLAHLYALHNLQDHFPPDKEITLDGQRQQELMMIVDDHRAAVETSLTDLSHQLGPLMAAYNVKTSAALEDPFSAWQSESRDALSTARAIDHLLRSLLATGDTPISAEAALPQIEQDLAQLAVELAQLKHSEAFNKNLSEKREAQATER